MNDIFRKTALDKISSPDQLDQVIVITPPGFFIAMLGAGIMLLTTLIWSIFGRIPVSISANGMVLIQHWSRLLTARMWSLRSTIRSSNFLVASVNFLGLCFYHSTVTFRRSEFYKC